MSVILLIAARIIVNPLSNVFQKKLIEDRTSPLLIIFVIHFLLTIVSIPVMKFIPLSNHKFEFYVYIFICALFAVSGNSLLIAALRYSDLSILGPVNSYKSIISMIFGIFLIQEIPGFLGITGVLLILAGSYVITDNDEKTNNKLSVFFKERGVQLRMAALVLTGIEAVLLKKAIILSSPLVTFVTWCYAGLIISGLALLFRITDIHSGFKQLHIKKITVFNLFLTTGIMQLCTLLVFNQVQVSYSLALFQISSLISVILGYHYFNEKNIKRRLAGALFMLTGSVIIILLS